MNEDSARRAIADHLGVSRAMVVDAAGLRDLGADSLDLISLTMRLEMDFNVTIPNEDAHGCATVRDVLDVLALSLDAARDEALQVMAVRARGCA